MKIYGFEDSDIARGELRAVEGDAADMAYPEDLLGSLDWEFLSTRFSEARSQLATRMADEGCAPELIEAVRGLKASFVLVEDR